MGTKRQPDRGLDAGPLDSTTDIGEKSVLLRAGKMGIITPHLWASDKNHTIQAMEGQLIS